MMLTRVNLVGVVVVAEASDAEEVHAQDMAVRS
jgi:hypothetical protein